MVELIQQELWFQSTWTREDEEEDEEEKTKKNMEKSKKEGASVSKVWIIVACNPFNWIVLCLWGLWIWRKKSIRRRKIKESGNKFLRGYTRKIDDRFPIIQIEVYIQCVFARITFSTRMCTLLVIHASHLRQWRISFSLFCLLHLLLNVTSL